jgi:hypothetical protein
LLGCRFDEYPASFRTDALPRETTASGPMRPRVRPEHETDRDSVGRFCPTQ